MDQNYIGIPQEAYALSNNPKVKWRKPTFNETQFVVKDANVSINLELKKWRDR